MSKEQNRPHEQLLVSVEQVLHRQIAAPLPAGLYLVATPIGNLADISLRALAVLASADIVYCEDKRHSSRLLNHYGLHADLKAYHEHNAARERDRLLSFVRDGKSVALISDAGTPLVSDPGYKLVLEARTEQLEVTAIPGPSAPITALVSSGLATDMFQFAGFLPPKKSARQKRLRQLAGIEATLIFFESPKRLKACLADIADCYGSRPAAIARELTKLHEEVATGSLKELAAQFEEQASVKGEIVILVAGADKSTAALSDEDLSLELEKELRHSSLRDAVQSVCARFDLPRSRVYDLAIAVKNGNRGPGGAGE